MKKATTWILALALTVLGATFCQAAELAQVVHTLEQGYANLKDLQADFSQRSNLAAMKREEKGSGRLYMKKGNFRFDYTKPKQQIISNGDKVWYYLPDQKQVMLMGLEGVAVNYLTGMGHVSKDFSIAFAKEPRDKQGNYILELTPKQKTPAMAKLQLTIEQSAVEQFVSQGHAAVPFPILASVVFDQVGSTTRMEFSNVKVNRGVDNGKFQFKVPAGVEVIKR